MPMAIFLVAGSWPKSIWPVRFCLRGMCAVEVFAERFRSQGEYFKVTEASLTYVAIDEMGKPRPIAGA